MTDEQFDQKMREAVQSGTPNEVVVEETIRKVKQTKPLDRSMILFGVMLFAASFLLCFEVSYWVLQEFSWIILGIALLGSNLISAVVMFILILVKQDHIYDMFINEKEV